MSDLSDETPIPGVLYAERPKRRSTRQRVSDNGHCSKCGAWWRGMITAHCSACCRTFTGLKTFDKHRAGSHPYETRHCVYPVKVGLIDAGRAYPCWGLDETDRRWEPE